MLRERTLFFSRSLFGRPLHRGEAKALWRWSNFLQSVDPPERERVLINVDETSVRLVPDNVSRRAYRLFLEGVTMGRRASLAARRSTVTHVAAITDTVRFQRLLPQGILVGENQLSEAKLTALQSNKPECAHIWSYNTGWMTAAIMARYVRLLGRVLKNFRKSLPLPSLFRCASSSHQCRRSACRSCGPLVGLCHSGKVVVGLATVRHASICFLQTNVD